MAKPVGVNLLSVQLSAEVSPLSAAGAVEVNCACSVTLAPLLQPVDAASATRPTMTAKWASRPRNLRENGTCMAAQYNKKIVSTTSARHRSERGAALVLALLVVALLMTMVLEFDRSVRLEHRAAGNYRDETAAFYLAQAGLAMGQALLQDDYVTAVDVDSLDEPWALEGAATPIGRGSVTVSIIDEERKFPINSLVSGNNVDPTRAAQFNRLLRALQIDERLTDAIVDWIDPDHDANMAGAENSYYESLPTPYRAHDAPIDSLDELRLVKGMTEEIYQRLAPHLTVAPVSTINVNTADPLVIGALSDSMTPDLVNRLVAERPIENTGRSISDILGTAKWVSDFRTYVGVQSQFFTIEAEGAVNGIRSTVTIQFQRGGPVLTLLWVRSPA
jgi:general secretion pathway protein K